VDVHARPEAVHLVHPARFHGAAAGGTAHERRVRFVDDQ
jgi:hypothetical protein